MGKFLDQTLDSILIQNFDDYEVIIVDGYSTDDTADIINYFGHKLNIKTVLSRPTDQVDAINFGIQLSQGDILAFINADDVYLPGCFKEIQSKFDNNPQSRWLYGKGKIIDEKGIFTRKFITKFKELWKYNYRTFTWLCYIVQPTIFWRKRVCIGNFNRDLKYAFDYDYMLRLGKQSKPLFIDKYLACWRCHSNSLSVNNYKEQVVQAEKIGSHYSNGLIDRIIRKTISFGVVSIYDILSKK
jgi:glycosyltransferase involved in cell wall biosynthesis